MGVIIWACIHYAKQMNGQVTFGNVFSHGFKVTAGIAAIMSVYTFIAIKFIHPELLEKTLDQARAEMEKNPDMNADAIDMALSFTRKFFLPMALAGSLFGTAILGAIASLIGAGVAKKNPITPFENAG
jgi:NADH:ubiquinone oxidoreductase subunit 6 (subunit J)